MKLPCQRMRRLVANTLRGNLSLPAVVFVWTGLWNTLDLDAPGGVGLWKELLLVLVGTVVMLWTGTYFSNAGMERWDEDGPLSRLNAILDAGNMKRREKFNLYAISLVAMAGSIVYWDGVYTLCEEHVWENTWRYNLLCTVLGGVGLVWVMRSEALEDKEDRAEKEHSRNDGDSTDAEDADGRHYDLSACQEEGKAGVTFNHRGGGGGDGEEQGNGASSVVASCPSNCAIGCANRVSGRGGKAGFALSGPAALAPLAKAQLYAKGMFGNICGVVMWKGVENLIVEQSLDTDWTGLVVYAAGTVAVLAAGSWLENCGLEEDDGAGFLSDAPALGSSSVRGEAGLGGEGTEKKEGGGCFSRCFELPEWLSTVLELVGVIAMWTGVEWYIWEEDYIVRPWYRDWCYIAGGLAVLLATGTFLNLSGAPLGGNARVKQEIAPLLPPPLTTLGAPAPPPSFRWTGSKRVQQQQQQQPPPPPQQQQQQEYEMRGGVSSAVPPALSARSNSSQQVWPKSARRGADQPQGF